MKYLAVLSHWLGDVRHLSVTKMLVAMAVGLTISTGIGWLGLHFGVSDMTLMIGLSVWWPVMYGLLVASRSASLKLRMEQEKAHALAEKERLDAMPAVQADAKGVMRAPIGAPINTPINAPNAQAQSKQAPTQAPTQATKLMPAPTPTPTQAVAESAVDVENPEESLEELQAQWALFEQLLNQDRKENAPKN